MSPPQHLMPDYKPATDSAPRRPPRATWFAAGLGVPLISMGLMSPEQPGETEAAVVEPGPSVVATGTAAPEPEPAGELASLPMEEPAPAPAAAAGELLNLAVKPGDSLDRLFARHNLDRGDLARIMKLDLARKHLRVIRPGDEIQIRHDGGQLLELTRNVSVTEALQVAHQDEQFAAEMVAREVEYRRVTASGVIDSSLFEAAARAGVSDRLIMNLAGIFAWDIDFVLDIRRGDQFRLLYEELWRDGERVGVGRIVAAEFVNRGEPFHAFYFQDESGRADYYGADGRSLRKAFVRAPLSFSRISSNFNPRRRHPKLNTIRAHRGVDYAAPTGTPVKAAGDGKIIFRGRKGGYGNTVILQHGGNITTLYAHLSRFAKQRSGSRVSQGDVIGYVGSTGLATGPHLHYEYRRNGVHMNPRTVQLPDAAPLDDRYMPEFQVVADQLRQELDSHRPLLASEGANPTT